ncbi:aromatase/cyclase [Bailinhaonella thermotolerans]|uniref:Aromatase n=1 Tax=Bailinhaonella thermotolerans TaxID=1070861 RepID=A0A3A4AZW3_9ACTN|nr:aromatase/cyclase [Bailinhaonella thermotolerans]RJL36232.1 aromatase [Bailinhaonella thermotolerans]
MTAPSTVSLRESVSVSAPAHVVRDLILDAEGWVQLHRRHAHAEVLEHGEDEALIQHWVVVDDHSVRTWRSRRRIQDEHRVVFEHEPAVAPFAEVRGAWTLTPTGAGGTEVRLDHDFTLLDDDPGAAASLGAAVGKATRENLATLKHAAEARDALADLIISFEDPLFVAGEIEDVYQYLYEADKWPDRIPHVTRLVLEERTPGVQFFDMDTVSADGSRHTTRSVRICLPHRKIVYKQTRPPATMTAHTGHWLFTPTPEGVIASARHTATIRPEGLHLLGEGMTMRGARRYLRKVLSANSMGNLRLAKEYAEGRASRG